MKRVLNPFLHPKIIFDIYMAITGQQKIVKVVHEFAREVSSNRSKKDVFKIHFMFSRPNSIGSFQFRLLFKLNANTD